MKKNILLVIEYLGTNYFGWQIQSKKNKKEITIQGVLENALLKLFKQPVRVNASGRTDRGVHAKAQYLNFKIDTEIPLPNIKKALNASLPEDIKIKEIKIAPLDFHSRFSAKAKTYLYIIYNRKDFSVFWSNFSWQITEKINLALTRRVAKKIVGKRDFYIFAKGAKNYKSCIRDLKKISIKKKEDIIYLEIKANGFLHQMARNIVNFLIQAGTGKIDINEAEAVLAGKKDFIKKPAPPQGLYLKKVDYKIGI
ncbi:MAG: tRNA pseudouridine(38-40) synthase TruA [Candidatus Omnitrophica bacterium]|nr:tRNA pseudouridine(38-40) synthase TruA [Candidatus Omnitrophota bacterium]